MPYLVNSPNKPIDQSQRRGGAVLEFSFVTALPGAPSTFQAELPCTGAYLLG